MAEALVLIHPSGTPSGFGVGQDGETLEIISGCCLQPILYGGGLPDVTLSLAGSPKGVVVVTCPCGEKYRGYGNPSINVRTYLNSGSIGEYWLGPWVGLENVEVEVSE